MVYGPACLHQQRMPRCRQALLLRKGQRSLQEKIAVQIQQDCFQERRPSSAFATSSDLEVPADDHDSSSGAGTPLSLSADQIVRILQQNPDLVVELKSQVADRLQQQGTDVDANNITDQMLYDQIATNADLRANITTFLRARGYMSSNDLPAATPNISDGGTGGRSALGQLSLPAYTGTDAARAAAVTGLLPGTSSPNQTGIATGSIQSANSMGNSLDSEQRRGQETVSASTDLPKVLRQPAPYNLQSMRDLYTQIPEQSATLRRFGSEVFVNRSILRDGAWRRRSRYSTRRAVGSRLCRRVGGYPHDQHVGRDDPEHQPRRRSGWKHPLARCRSLDVAGLTLQRAENLIGAALKKQYRDVQATVTVSRLRSVRVYVVGDVQRPGGL